MQKFGYLLGSAVFFFVAPGTLAFYLPWLISRWIVKPPLLGIAAFSLAGAGLALAGLALLLECFARFALKGLGTPAPIAPPQHLVVSGFYRFVRNPMYVAVLAIVLGQALYFASPVLLGYAAVLWLGFTLFVMAYEEPALAHQFGTDYAAYRAHVPRWIPRIRPWRS